MNFTNVAVFDAETMTEVGSDSGNTDTGSGEGMLSLTKSGGKTAFASNVRRVLEMIYGHGNVADFSKGNLKYGASDPGEHHLYELRIGPAKRIKRGCCRMRKLQESSLPWSDRAREEWQERMPMLIRPATPIRTGRQKRRMFIPTAVQSASGFIILLGQKQINPGVLENTTVGVTINTEDTSIDEKDLVRLIASAAGIEQTDADQKITVLRTLAASSKNEESVPVGTGDVSRVELPLPVWVALGTGIVLILLLILLLLLQKRKEKTRIARQEELLRQEEEERQKEEEERQQEIQKLKDQLEESDHGTSLLERAADIERVRVMDKDEEMRQNEEILNLRMKHSMKLKQNIGEFVDENPQIAAKLIQNWLMGKEESHGRNNRK